MCLATSTIIVRIFQILYYKCKLFTIAPKKFIKAEPKKSVNIEIEMQSAGNANTNTNNMKLPRDEADPLRPKEVDESKYDDKNDDNPNNFTMDKFVDTKHDKKKETEDNASSLTNYNFALYFISHSTFSDASFDIIQSIVFIFGYSTTTTSLVVLGTMIGFSSEVLDFVEEVLGFGIDICRNGVLGEYGPIMEKIHCILISISCIVAQITSILFM